MQDPDKLYVTRTVDMKVVKVRRIDSVRLKLLQDAGYTVILA